MAETTGIGWCHHTWSQHRGCAKVSTGCEFCYAEKGSHRNPAILGIWGIHGTRPINADWGKPVSWNRKATQAGERHRIFPSLCDWLEDREELVKTRSRFMNLVCQTRNLDWLLLTKRPENYSRLIARSLEILIEKHATDTVRKWMDCAPENVWNGVSVENQEYAEKRLPILVETKAAIRWVSYEPALGPVDFRPWLDRIDWIVCGGESGSKARPFHMEWAEDVAQQCADAGVAFFMKQVGANPFMRPPGAWGHVDPPPMKFKAKKGDDINEWPEHLRIQEYPKNRLQEVFPS